MRRKLPLLLPLIVLILGVGLRVWDPPVMRDLRYRAFDVFQQLHPRPYDANLPVRIVAIDEASLRDYGQWPWSRALLAQLVDRLREADVAAIAFDVLFPEPDRSSVTVLMQDMPDGAARQALELALASGALIDNDQAFTEAIAKAPVVLALKMDTSETGLPPPKPKAGIAIKGESPLAYIKQFFGGVISNLPEFNEAASGLGSMDAFKDSDGTLRQMVVVLANDDVVYPSLSVEALRVAQGAPGIIIKTSGALEAEESGATTGVQAVRAGRITVNTTPHGELWLYDAGHQEERFISAGAVLDGSVDPNELAGTIVFIGATAAGLFDAHTTPLSVFAPGVEQHAQVVEQVLSGVFLSRPIWAERVEYAAVLMVGLLVLASFAIVRLGAFWAAVLGFAAIMISLAGAWYAFAVERLLLDPLTPTVVGIFVYATAAVGSYLDSERQRRHVRTAFSQYVSPAVVARIADNPAQVNLGGESRELTLLFCDIRGFTSLSERLDPESLTRLINRFLTEMSTAVLESGGTIDKYIGDCIMGFWNAPLDVPQHASKALETVLEMRRRLDRLNRDLRAESKDGDAPELTVGMGLNSGQCSVGNMGSAQRLAYTCVGDAVNLAARLEGLTRLYGVDCLVSESTAQAASQELALVEVDRIRVKGRATNTAVFALLGSKAEAEPLRPLIDAIGQFLERFRAGDWTGAAAALEKLTPLAKDSTLAGLARRYRERLSEAAEAGPPADWDGTFVATEK